MGFEDTDGQVVEDGDEGNYQQDYQEQQQEYQEEGEAQGDDDDDAYYENPVEIIQEFANNPLMQRAQNEELKRVTIERENLGVQLYGLQQQLARVQITLETAHSEYNNIVDIRLQEESMLRDISKNNGEQKALLETYQKQQKKHATELENLNETIRQINQYNEEVKSEISQTKGGAIKLEQDMQQLEKFKENQDLYVDSFNSKVIALQVQIANYSKQYDIQKQDTNDANQVLQDTIHELELIDTEKKQLLIQWKAALSGLSRRDEALSQASATLAVAESAVHDYDMEIESAKRDLQVVQAAHEALVNLRDRLENELHWVDDNLNKIRIERDQMQERYTLLAKSLAQTDGDAKKLDLVAKGLNNEHDAIISNLQ
eukprot:gene41572-51495_t